MMNRKPRLFIGSSVESLPIADAVNLNLDHEVEVTIWRNGTFELSNSAIDSLTKKAGSVDFALFIFSPDDVAIIRNKKEAIVRDNVLFELGLFIGAIGKDRCFILKPRDIDLHFPTDLLGVTPADYEPNRSDGDLASAVNHACVLMKNRMKELSILSPDLPSPKVSKTPKLNVGDVTEYDKEVLAALLPTATEDFHGYAIHVVRNHLNDKSHRVDLSIIRLERHGYIEKKNEEDQNGYEYYAFTISSEGIELLLENEEEIFKKKEPLEDLEDSPF